MTSSVAGGALAMAYVTFLGMAGARAAGAALHARAMRPRADARTTSRQFLTIVMGMYTVCARTVAS